MEAGIGCFCSFLDVAPAGPSIWSVYNFWFTGYTFSSIPPRSLLAGSTDHQSDLMVCISFSNGWTHYNSSQTASPTISERSYGGRPKTVISGWQLDGQSSYRLLDNPSSTALAQIQSIIKPQIPASAFRRESEHRVSLSKRHMDGQGVYFCYACCLRVFPFSHEQSGPHRHWPLREHQRLQRHREQLLVQSPDDVSFSPEN